MKTAVVFLLVALSCCFDIPAARTYGKQTHHPSSFPKSPVPTDCIIRLLKSSLPNALLDLQKMLCCFAKAEKENNQKLYKEFLASLHQLLKDAGCTVDELLKLQGAVEQLGDKVGDVCRDVVLQILTCVENLELSDIVFETLCKLAGDVIVKLADALRELNLNIVTDLTGSLGVGGKGKKGILGLL